MRSCRGMGFGVLLLVLMASSALAEESRVYASAEQVEPLAAGSRIPPASVRSVEGKALDLKEQLRGRGALLIFYRGGW